jgi:hypothetical protein
MPLGSNMPLSFAREGQFELVLTFESRHIDDRPFRKPRHRLSQNRETGCGSVHGNTGRRKPDHDRLPGLAVGSECGLPLVVCFGKGQISVRAYTIRGSQWGLFSGIAVGVKYKPHKRFEVILFRAFGVGSGRLFSVFRRRLFDVSYG